jgi:hypothetical protein
VTVNPVGPLKWTYTVSAGPVTIFTAVQVHSTSDLSKCKVDSALPKPSSTFDVSRPAPTDLTISTPTGSSRYWVGITFTLECDLQNGTVTLFFITGSTVIAGGPTATGIVVGPVAGPE